MQYRDLIAGMARFGVREEEILTRVLGVTREQIQTNVVIAPGWEPEKVPALGRARLLSSCGLYNVTKVWEVEGGITYIKTGFGAPLLLDALLALGMSGCGRILFVGSVGALDAGMGIGDLVVPRYAVCGDGASRYVAAGGPDRDVFGETAYPHGALFRQLREETRQVCEKHGVRWHIGRTFSSDTIFAQFAHMDKITGMGCNSIEMETAAAFRAAGLMGIPLAALLSVSDNTAADKSLLTGISPEEMEYRQFVRGELLPGIIHGLFRHSSPQV